MYIPEMKERRNNSLDKVFECEKIFEKKKFKCLKDSKLHREKL